MATTRDKGSPAAILLAVVSQLQTQLTTAELPVNESNCYLSLDPNAKKRNATGDLIYVVSPSSGTFDEGMIDGGGLEQLTNEFYLIVTIQSALQLDEAQREESFLTDASFGVLQAGTNVLKALALWSPAVTDVDTAIQTRDPLFPTGYEFSKEGRSKGSMTLTFKCKFDWDAS